MQSIALNKAQIFLSIFLLYTFPTFSNNDQELSQINLLIDKIEASNLVFIRNGKEYNSVKAAKHLRKKFYAAQVSFFSPPRSEWTVKLFIERVATKSFLSSKPYLVKLNNGQVLELKIWLKNQLKNAQKL